MSVLACALVLTGCGRRRALSRAYGVREDAVRFFAEELAANHPGSRAVIVGNPYVRKDGQAHEVIAFEEASVEGLRDGFGDAVTVIDVVVPDLKDGAWERPRSVPGLRPTTTPLSFLMTPDAFDRIAESQPNADLLVSLVGLPADLRAVRLWEDPDGPAVAALLPDLRLFESEDELRWALTEGPLTAILVKRPAAPADSTRLSGSARERFEQRYLIVTAGNVEAALDRYRTIVR
jgi:hypothetical protein